MHSPNPAEIELNQAQCHMERPILIIYSTSGYELSLLMFDLGLRRWSRSGLDSSQNLHLPWFGTRRGSYVV